MSELAKKPGEQWLESILTDSRAESLAEICEGSGVSVARIRGSLMEALLANPGIMNANPASVFRSVLQAARLGVVPSGMRNGAYYAVYGKDCKLGLGYGALIELAKRFGNMRSPTTGTVYPNDEFEYMQGDDGYIRHKPTRGDRGGPASEYYAIVWFEGGGREIEVMRRDEVDRIRARSRNGNNGPWKSDYDEMARKTVLLRLMKRVPMPVEWGEAVQATNDADGYADGTDSDDWGGETRADRMNRNARKVLNEADSPESPDAGERNRFPDAESGGDSPDPSEPAEAIVANRTDGSDEPTDEELAGQLPFDPDELDTPF